MCMCMSCSFSGMHRGRLSCAEVLAEVPGKILAKVPAEVPADVPAEVSAEVLAEILAEILAKDRSPALTADTHTHGTTTKQR